MGTYIDAVLEMDLSDGETPFADAGSIDSLTTAGWLLDRDYGVFDALAGGRSAVLPPDVQDLRSEPLIPPRGMPNPCSLAVAHHYYFIVAETTELPDRSFWPAHRCVTPDIASDWIRNKRCHEGNVVQWIPGDRTWRVVSEPGNYGATWLSLEEVDASLAHHAIQWDSLRISYRILRDAMATLVQEFGSSRVRMTLWFS